MLISNLSATSLAEIGKRFSDPDFLSRGCVQIISVEAVRDRLGKRWFMRRDAVVDFVQRQFRKDFEESDLITQVDETQFLLLQPTTERFGAEARAIGLLREVLTFFLGATSSGDLRVGTVVSIGPNGIEQRPFAPESMNANEVGPVAGIQVAGVSNVAAESSFTPTPIEPVRPGHSKTVQGDNEYSILFVTDPIWSVRNNAIVSHILKPIVFIRDTDGSQRPADPDRYTLKDRVRVDVIILAEAARLLSSGGVRFGLHVPIHQATLHSLAGRQAVIWRLHELGPLAANLVIDIHGFEAGAPVYRIAEAVGPLSGKCLGVLVQAANLSVDVSAWRGLNLSAISIDFSSVGSLPGEFRRDLQLFSARANDVARALVAYSLSSRSRMLMAWAEGFTHLSGERLGDKTKGSLTPIRYQPAELYAT